MSSSIEAIKSLAQLLKIEQEEDRAQYRERILKSSIGERRTLGVTWYPIVIKDSYYGYGERLVLEIERPTGTNIPHQFQFGCTASLFSNHDREQHQVSGIVTAVRFNQVRLTLQVDELPEWADMGKLGLDLLFDESSYKEMNNVMQLVQKAEKNRLAELREILVGEVEPRFQETHPITIPRLNPSQNHALNNVLSALDVAVIHGPPGTGKTTTLVETILATLKTEKQVLVCAPSNTAVDLLTEKLAERGLNVVRFGNPAKVSESLLAHTVDAKTTAHAEYKSIKEFKKRAAEFKNFASKYKRNFGREERDQRKLILEESKKLHAEAEKIEKFIIDDLLTKAQVITATLVGSAHYTLKEKTFTTAFIDEAGQALEPACWIPISKAKRIVLAGDHLQLPPTIKSAEAAKLGLSTTLLEKIMLHKKVDVMLETQYRMHEHIMEFSNRSFYKGKLLADESVRTRTLPLLDGTVEATAFEFVDTAGCGFEEKSGSETTSLCNEGEADLLIKHLVALAATVAPSTSIGIISPYKAQVNLLQEKIANEPSLKQFKQLSVNSVDGFQGQERDIIYISLVRSNDKKEIGFLADKRRMNVAITRARMKLVMIGDSATIFTAYTDLLDYAESIKAHKSAWEYLY